MSWLTKENLSELAEMGRNGVPRIPEGRDLKWLILCSMAHDLNFSGKGAMHASYKDFYFGKLYVGLREVSVMRGEAQPFEGVKLIMPAGNPFVIMTPYHDYADAFISRIPEEIGQKPKMFIVPAYNAEDVNAL